jgi:hypothetical protein
LRPQTLQNLFCKFLLAILDLSVRSRQLESFLPQHNPHFIPGVDGGSVHDSNLVEQGVEELGARVPFRLAIFYSGRASVLLPYHTHATRVQGKSERTYRLVLPCMKKAYTWWALRQA